MNWPNDADGDVLRNLKSQGFDFESEHTIDFNIDFDIWPLPEETIHAILELYPTCQFIDPDEEDIKNGYTLGYAQFQVEAKLTYQLIVQTQKAVTQNLNQFGGRCESWGLWQN